MRVMTDLKGQWREVPSPLEFLAQVVEKTQEVQVFSLRVGGVEETARLLEGAISMKSGESTRWKNGKN